MYLTSGQSNTSSLRQPATSAGKTCIFACAKRRRLTHDVGNLCLTEDNSRYGNKCFDEKGVCQAWGIATRIRISFRNIELQ